MDERVYYVKRVQQSSENSAQTAVMHSTFAQVVARGLLGKQKTLPCRFFYDAEGSRIFEQICTLPEYYPTRSETEILAKRSNELAKLCHRSVIVVELGSGSAIKTRLVLKSLLKNRSQLEYVPIDISISALEATAAALRLEYPRLKVTPIAREYEEGLRSLERYKQSQLLILWLGTSIGNLEPEEACIVLRRLHHAISHDGLVALGIDLQKDRAIIEQAYNDAQGVTAKFNKNILARINHELGGHFDLDRFYHRAFYNEMAGRVEMHLVSKCGQCVAIDSLGIDVKFRENEAIHTENSYKFSRDQIEALACNVGFRMIRHWTDEKGLFSFNVLSLRR